MVLLILRHLPRLADGHDGGLGREDGWHKASSADVADRRNRESRIVEVGPCQLASLRAFSDAL